MFELYQANQEERMKRFYLKIFIVAAGLLVYNGGYASPVYGHEYHDPQKSIKGQVKDQYGSPLQGVLVRIKNQDRNTQTDARGYYSLEANVNDVLIYELEGYVQQEQKVKGKNMDVFLQKSSADKVYSTLYGRQKAATFSGSIATINAQNLSDIPVPNVSDLLSGRLNGLITTQSSTDGVDRSFLSLRGRNPIVVVDGAVRDLDGLSPNEIENITVLKDPVSLAAMGMRSSDGVVLVQTKRGTAGRQIINFSAQTAIQESIYLPKYLDAYHYALLANEASVNDGRPQIYSQTDLEGYKNGTDPYRYPNVDWYGATLKPRYSFNRFNLNVSGGGKSARYFIALENQNQGGIFKDGPNNFNTNNTINRYNFRSNVDVDIDKNLSISLKLAGKYEQANSPGAGVGSIMDQIQQTPSNAYPIYNADGSLSGNSLYTKNIFGQLYQTGYTRDNRRTIFIDADLNRKLGFVTEGLSLNGSIHYTSYYDNTIFRSRSSFAVFLPVYNQDNVVQSYTQFGNNTSYSNSNGYNDSFSRRLNFDAGLHYQRIFGEHAVNAALQYNWDQYDIGTALTHAYKGLLARGSYAFKEKYFADISVAWQGTEQYMSGKRYGFFPAISAGYDIAKEDFLKDGVFNQLKIKASAGILGFDRSSNFAYQPYYSTNSNAYYFGSTGTGMAGWTEASLGNPNLTWEKTKAFNAGIDAVVFKNSLTISIDYYNNLRYRVLQQRGNSNALLGTIYPLENIGKYNYNGVEFGLNYVKKIGEVELSLNGNAQFSGSKVIDVQELPRKYTYQEQTGQQIGQVFGLVALGLFQSNEEINASPKQFSMKLQPGDIKYKDLNGDNIINEDDVTAIGKTSAPIYYAGSVGLKFKNFDFLALLQGVTNKDFYFIGNNAWEFQNNGGNVQQFHLNRWTPATAAVADYPRLSFGPNANNHTISTYWLRNGDYLRLKNVQLGYTLPSSLTKRVGLANLRLFASGFNLLTLTRLKDLDPESLLSNYPLYRSYNIGLTAKF